MIGDTLFVLRRLRILRLLRLWAGIRITCAVTRGRLIGADEGTRTMAAQMKLDGGPIAAPESEQAALGEIDRFLVHALMPDGTSSPRMVGPNGEEIELPRSLFHVLHQVVRHLAQGKVITVVPLNKNLTTQEAADILNVSRPYLIKLLDQGEIPFVKTGTHRRIRFSDLMQYKQRCDAERRRGLAQLTHMSLEMGLYGKGQPEK